MFGPVISYNSIVGMSASQSGGGAAISRGGEGGLEERKERVHIIS